MVPPVDAGTIEAAWQMCAVCERDTRTQTSGKVELLQPGQVKSAAWPTTLASDGDRLTTSRMTDTKEPRPKMTAAAVVVASNWQTCVCEDKEQSGSAKRGPSQTSQARASAWSGPNARDWKDTGSTQGKRKSPNLGTQTNQAAIPAAGFTLSG